MKGTEDNESAKGMLRIQFLDESSDNLRAIGLDKFLETFEEKKLAFLNHDKTKDNKDSHFFKFVNR